MSNGSCQKFIVLTYFHEQIYFTISQSIIYQIMEAKSTVTGDFYIKLRKEYAKSAKPIVYQFTFSEQPKAKKFRILMSKFVEIMKEGMKDEYKFQQQVNYWGELQKHFSKMPQMDFILTHVYEISQKKIRIFFALLLQTKKIFSFYKQLLEKTPHLYKNVEQKRAGLDQELEIIDFLKDGQVEIDSEYVRQFIQYKQKKQLEQIQMISQIRNLLSELADQAERLDRQQKKRKLQQADRIKRQEQLRKQRQQQKKREKLGKNFNQPSPNSNNQNTIGKETKLIPAAQKIQAKVPILNTPTPQLDMPFQLPKKHRHMKNSDILFQEQFKDQIQVFKFDQKPVPSQKKTQCYECNQPLRFGLYIIGTNMNYCNYFGEWFCNDHTADERIQIPFKAYEQFDLRGYNVSKRAYDKIRLYFDKPIIEIKYEAPIVRKNKKLYQFLILKRQLHLMYDSICISELMDKMLRGRTNYLLKQNYFSLKNLYDIYNGHEVKHLEGEFNILVKHFYKCELCQNKKGRVCAVCSHVPKIFAFQLRETFSCPNCKKISHRRCLKGNKCFCQTDQ